MDYETTSKLQNLLDKYELLVYVDDDFEWKDMALSQLSRDSRIGIVTEREALELYRMYEFSDRFIMLSESEQYGSIWNYVRSGMISASEALDQLIRI